MFDYNFSPQHNLTYQIVRCCSCSHVYASPLPNNLWENYSSVSDKAYLKNQQSRYATAEKIIKKIKHNCSQGRLLDVGCATGDFLFIAQKYYQVEGLELSSWSTKITRQRGFKVHSCFLKDISKNNYYDIITLWGVIEHFENPRQEIKSIFKLLKPGGVVCLWTGDIDCFLSRLLGKKWWYIQGQHIQLFSRRSLFRLFKEHGFKSKYLGRYPYVMSIQAISKSIKRYPIFSQIFAPLINALFSPGHQITISLPGEMLAIFQKPINQYET